MRLSPWLVLFSLLVLANNLLLPLGEASDEPSYLDYASFLVHHGYPPSTIEERILAGPKGGFAPLYFALLTPALKIGDFFATPIHLGAMFALHFHTYDELIPWRGFVLTWHLARFISYLIALATLTATWQWSRLLFKDDTLAWAITLMVAFMPRFVINSAVLSDDNLVALFATIWLYLLVKITISPQNPFLYIAAGITLGLAVLSKYNGAMLGLELLLLGGYLYHQKRLIWAHLIKLGAAFALTMLPWLAFVLRYFNYFSELGFTKGLAIIMGEPLLTGTVHTASSYLSLSEWSLTLLKSFWLEFGWMRLISDNITITLVAIGLLLASAGWLKHLNHLVRSPQMIADSPMDLTITRSPQSFADSPIDSTITQSPQSFADFIAHFPTLLCITHTGLFLSVVLSFLFISPTLDTCQGRHLLPTLPTLAYLVLRGWQHLVANLPLKPVTWLYVSFSLISNLTFIGLTVQPYFVYTNITPLHYNWGSQVQLTGYHLTPQTIKPEQPITLYLYWQHLTPSYRLSFQIVNQQGQLILQKYAYLDPRAAWREGIVPMKYTYIFPTDMPADSYQIQVEVQDLATGKPLNGNVEVGQFQLE